MGFRKSIHKKWLAIALSAALVFTLIAATTLPSFAAEGEPDAVMTVGAANDTKASKEVAAPASANVEKTVPAWQTGDGTIPAAPRALKAPAASIDPSDLSSWIVYDHYYDPAWTDGNKPSNWDSNHPNHPFFYWKESSDNAQSHPTFYDLSTTAGKQKLQSEVLDGVKHYDGVTPLLGYFSQHIYTEGSANNAQVTFLGYGKTYKTDFAIAPVTSAELKSIGFDIDASKVNAHTLDGFGVLINAGITSSGLLKGYAVNFKMYNHDSDTKNGTIRLVDYANGVEAANLHAGTIEQLASGTQLGTFDLKQSPTGKIRVDMDIEATKVVVKLAYYTSATQLSTPQTFTSTLADTTYSGFGPFVNYSGEDHDCGRLSYVRFSDMQMSIGYDVIFDPNGGSFPPGTVTRYSSISPGHSIADHGYGFPTPPTRAGYTFIGWNYNKDSSGLSFGVQDPINKITTVYAMWKADVKITYIAGTGGQLQGGSPQIETVPLNQLPRKVPTPIPNTGYHFKHWVDETGKIYLTAADIAKVEALTDKTYTAIFDRDLVKVEYRSAGNGTLQGTSYYPLCPVGLPLAQYALAPYPVPAAGYKFVGWTDVNNKPIDPATAVVGSNTYVITAHFDRLYTVTFVANGQIVGTKQLAKGDLIGPAPDPTPFLKLGDNFAYWSGPTGNHDNTQIQSVACTGDMTYTAKVTSGKVFGKR